MKKYLLGVGISFLSISNSYGSSLPLTGKVTIVPFASFNIPEELKKQDIMIREEIKEKGYHEDDNEYAKFLINLKKTSTSELMAYKQSYDVYDTHIKNSPSDIKLAIDFKKLPIIDNTVIGYAPIGSYVKSPKEGWNGIKVFFEDEKLGTCSYEFTDLALSHGGIQLPKEFIKYFVNGKPSSQYVEGNANMGFTYTVTWYNGLKTNSLDCASKDYSKDEINDVIELAKRIDAR